MREIGPSHTALRVALRRAAHQVLDDEPRVLDDPLAVRIVGERAAEIHEKRAAYQGRMAKYIRAFMVGRSRYAEDQLSQSFARGVNQYVILGAGLDTSAYRGAGASGIRVFEVDHPNTQKWKLKRLREAQISIPESVRHVAVDFERQNLATELEAAGFRVNQPAFVSSLGVVPYLTKEAAAHTFEFLGSFAAGSGVVFDYAIAHSSLGLLQRLASKAISRRVAKAGEPFKLYFAPHELDEFLKRFGFHSIVQMRSKDMNEKYFTGRKDGLRMGGDVGQIVSAWT